MDRTLLEKSAAESVGSGDGVRIWQSGTWPSKVLTSIWNK